MSTNPVIRVVNVGFKLALAAVIAYGIGLSVSLASSAANTFFYFTIQSNLIVCAVLLWGAIRLVFRVPEGRLGALIRNGATLWILITGFVFNFMLGGFSRFSGGLAQTSFILHYFAPVLTVVNWLLFEEKGKSRYLDTVIWMIYPLAYVLFSQIRLAIDGFAPYWFLDPLRQPPQGTGSVGMMLAFVAGMVAFFGLLGLLIIRIDRIWKKKAGAMIGDAAAVGGT